MNKELTAAESEAEKRYTRYENMFMAKRAAFIEGAEYAKAQPSTATDWEEKVEKEFELELQDFCATARLLDWIDSNVVAPLQAELARLKAPSTGEVSEAKNFFIWFCKEYGIRSDYADHTLEDSFWNDYHSYKAC